MDLIVDLVSVLAFLVLVDLVSLEFNMAKIEQYFFPIMAGAAVIGIYVFLKRPQAAVQANQPSTAGSGLPNYTPQAQTYQVNPPQLSAPSGITLLSDPYANAPGASDQPVPTSGKATLTNPVSQQKQPPLYLSFNFGPGHDLSKIPSSVNQGTSAGGCGCGCSSSEDSTTNCNSCNPPGIINHYTDGQGSVCMSSSKQRQVASNPQSWIQAALANLMGSGIDFGSLDPSQTLSPYLPGGEGGYDVPAAPSTAIPISAPGSGVLTKPVGGPHITPVDLAPTPLGGGKFGRGSHSGVGYGNPQSVSGYNSVTPNVVPVS